MKLEVLISCMNQNGGILLKKSNLNNVSALIVNQCDEKEERCVEIDEIHRMIVTNQRGLSRSRNMAIAHAKGDIVLLCDDDERFCDELEHRICKAYEEVKEADVIIFNMINIPRKLGGKIKKLNRLDLLKVASVQISFKLDSVRNQVAFDVNLGAGTGNGAGEENKFLLDCAKKGLKIYYYPLEIASVAQEKSTWFKGYTEEFFYQRGQTTRYTYGFAMSALYALYYAVRKRKMFEPNINSWKAFLLMMNGVLSNKLSNENVKH